MYYQIHIKSNKVYVNNILLQRSTRTSVYAAAKYLEDKKVIESNDTVLGIIHYYVFKDIKMFSIFEHPLY